MHRVKAVAAGDEALDVERDGRGRHPELLGHVSLAHDGPVEAGHRAIVCKNNHLLLGGLQATLVARVRIKLLLHAATPPLLLSGE